MEHRSIKLKSLTFKDTGSFAITSVQCTLTDGTKSSNFYDRDTYQHNRKVVDLKDSSLVRSVSCGEIVDEIDGTANVFTVSFLDKLGVEIAGYNP